MMQDSKSFLDMFIFDEPQAKMAEAKNVHPFVKNDDEFSKIGSMGALAAHAMQMNKMNGMFRGDTGELSQGAQQLAQKVNENGKTGILQRTAELLKNLIQPFPGDENDPRTPTGSKLIMGPDGQMYDENFIKTIPGGFSNMQEIERRKNIFKGM